MGLKKNNPGCLCCGETGTPCAYCTGDTTPTVSITFLSSPTAFSCSSGCDEMSGTYVLSQIAACLWQTTFQTSCNSGTLDWTLAFGVTTDYYWSISLFEYSYPTSVSWLIPTATPLVCQSTQTFVPAPGVDGACDFRTVSVQVN